MDQVVAASAGPPNREINPATRKLNLHVGPPLTLRIRRNVAAPGKSKISMRRLNAFFIFSPGLFLNSDSGAGSYDVEANSFHCESYGSGENRFRVINVSARSSFLLSMFLTNRFVTQL
jgi:hypothetical protein